MQATAKRVEEVVENIKDLSSKFASERRERQQRRELKKADFDALTDAGFHLTGVPPDMGGINGGVSEFTRPLCDMLRILAKGDPSVSLVASMHPAVIGGWLEVEKRPRPTPTHGNNSAEPCSRPRAKAAGGARLSRSRAAVATRPKAERRQYLIQATASISLADKNTSAAAPA